MVLFAEGGRTFKGTPEAMRYSLSGRKIRRFFKEGIRRLAADPDQVAFIPVWTEDGKVMPNRDRVSGFGLSFPRIWRQTIITIGEQVDLSGTQPRDVVMKFEDSLLAVAES